MLQGYARQVQGYNGSNSAQPERPWDSTQTLPSRHNKAQRPCQDGHAVIQAWGIAHVPRVVSREGVTRLSREQGQTTDDKMNGQPWMPIKIGKDDMNNVEDHLVSLVRRQPGELYRISTTTNYTTDELSMSSNAPEDIQQTTTQWETQRSILCSTMIRYGGLRCRSLYCPIRSCRYM